MQFPRLFGCLFVLMSPVLANAQECTIGTEQLVGLIAKDGTCHGFEKDFAQKYLHLAQSQCVPLPRNGHLLLGKCIPDAPPLPEEV